MYKNWSSVKFTYSELVKQHRNVNKIVPSVCHRINKLIIGRRKGKQVNMVVRGKLFQGLWDLILTI